MSSPPIRIELRVEGMGHVPSFKNSKVIGRRRLFTKPEYRKWMDKATQSFESQLWSALQTDVGATSTEAFPRSWIASLTQFDDSRQWLPELTVRAVEVPKGREGATVTLETIQDAGPSSQAEPGQATPAG